MVRFNVLVLLACAVASGQEACLHFAARLRIRRVPSL
jgi:hypothetical protein